jgi:CheY-like chemotaxis protein
MPHRILIVDDDLPTREGLAMVVAGAGYHTLTVGNVPAAQDLIAAAPPDLLITDVRIGLSNGLQLIAMAPVPLPAIVITGFADPSIEADARALGADFMLKPISPSALLERIADKLAHATAPSFKVGRRWVRRRLVRPVLLRVNDADACILEVSDGGVGLEIHWGNDRPLPASLDLDLDEGHQGVPVNVAWARQQDDHVWRCGGVIAETAIPHWRGLLQTFS